MKKFYLCSMLFALCFATALPARAVPIKKAEPVAVQKTSGVESTASMLPTALNLITGIQALNLQMKTLSAECAPTSSDITFVTKIMREYAKTGAADAQTMVNSMGNRPVCDSVSDYRTTATYAAQTTGQQPCFAKFTSGEDENMIWYGYPRPSSAKICRKADGRCLPKDEEMVSDIYDIFVLIDWAPADYLRGEETTAAKLLDKVETCSHSKLSAKKRAVWGEFLIGSAGKLGQKTNTGETMNTLNSVLQSGGGNPMQSIMGLAPALTQGMMK